jgi:hypothetical protein
VGLDHSDSVVFRSDRVKLDLVRDHFDIYLHRDDIFSMTTEHLSGWNNKQV